MRAATVWVSPFGSAKLTSASIWLGRSTGPRSFSVKLAPPLRSVVSGSLSATSLPSRPAAASLSSLSLPSCSAFLGSRGGSNENSS